MSEDILMRGRFESWDKLLLDVRSKVSGKKPEEVGRIIIEPNMLKIESAGKSFADRD